MFTLLPCCQTYLKVFTSFKRNILGGDYGSEDYDYDDDEDYDYDSDEYDYNDFVGGKSGGRGYMSGEYGGYGGMGGYAGM